MNRLQDQLVACLRRVLAGGKPVIPEAGRLLWSIFCDLAGARTSNGLGPNPISFTEIEAYMRIKRWPLSDAHIALLRAMDNAWLEHAHSKQKSAMPPRSASQSVNPAAFDAVFSS